MFARMLRAALLSATILFTMASQAVDKETIHFNFNPAANHGENPNGGLLRDQAGNFYGAALSGTIFEMSPPSSAGSNYSGSQGWTYTVLCNCSGTYADGFLVMDAGGNLYGADFFGGVYEFSPGASGEQWTGTLLYSFSGGNGNGPSPVILDSAGNLYGVYGVGGANNKGYVFELSPSSGGSWSLTDLHDFDGSDGNASAANEAGGLIGALLMDGSGNLYGVTSEGGHPSALCPTSGCGVIFKLTNNSGVWTETVLHSFGESDGMNPDAQLLMDSSGNLYGTANAGGEDGFGVVFETSLVGGRWETKDLYSFTNANGDGAYPNSPLIMDGSGNLYGATYSGGGYPFNCTVVNDNGCGTAFQLSKHGSDWKETVLHGFSAGMDGGFPGGVSFGIDGNLYGVVLVGGRFGDGAFYELSQ